MFKEELLNQWRDFIKNKYKSFDEIEKYIIMKQ